MATRIPAIRNQINLLKSHASPPGQPSVKARIPPTEPRVDDVTLNLPKPPADIGRFLYLELSSQVQHQAKENLIGRFPVEAFAGTVIQFSSEGREVAVVKGLEIH